MNDLRPDGPHLTAQLPSDLVSNTAIAAAPPVPMGKVANLSPALKAFSMAMRGLDRIAPRVSTDLMVKHFLRPRRRPSEYQTRLPEGAKRLAIDHRGQQLTGWSWGESGPSVLLVHGWEDHSGAMLRLVGPLRKRGYQVVAMDAPGHGLSPAMDTHLLDTGEALSTLMNQVGRFQAIIAHSYGGAAAAILLARQPRLMPDYLTLVSPMRDIRQHLAIFAGIARLSQAGWDRLEHTMQRQLGQSLDDISTLLAAEHINVPGLIVHDREDPLIPFANSARMAGRWTDAELLATQGLGHRRTLGCPEVAGEILTRMDRCLEPRAERCRHTAGSPV